jgi:hypothetical protein
MVGTPNWLHLFWTDDRVSDTSGEVFHRRWEPGTGVEEMLGVDLGRTVFRVAVSPNPASQACLISFWPFVSASGTVKIFDILGREVRSYELYGVDRIRWDLKDDEGKEVKSGVYFVWCEAGKVPSVTRRVTVLKATR